jgi:hypothetical protein
MRHFFRNRLADFRLRYFLEWIAACVGGLYLSYLALYVIAWFVVSGWSIDGYPFYLEEALVVGVTIGLCQWFVLRQTFRRAYWWVIATAIGTLISVTFVNWIFLRIDPARAPRGRVRSFL